MSKYVSEERRQARKERKRERQDATNPKSREERARIRAQCDAQCDYSHALSQQRLLMTKVQASKELKRGGIAAQRIVELQKLFKKGKLLPLTDEEILADERLREEAVAELEEALVRIQAAEAAVTSAPVLPLASSSSFPSEAPTVATPQPNNQFTLVFRPTKAKEEGKEADDVEMQEKDEVKEKSGL